ncbi:MAG TPA: BlaI/MecI/CopY family transcriptional regulator [Thermoanaerobaculia bacterium]|nr:BlaI/MecI/CopY family transcriptional regulator [Thermoanaerobaculia bacterium]
MKPRSIGDQELALLRYVAEQGVDGVTVGQAAEGFGEARGLARSTVLTMMERLRGKRHLRRRRIGGVFQYSPTAGTGEVLRGVVHSFVEKTLGGSVSPFVNYLAEEATVSDEELAELEQLVARLQSQRQEPPE